MTRKFTGKSGQFLSTTHDQRHKTSQQRRFFNLARKARNAPRTKMPTMGWGNTFNW